MIDNTEKSAYYLIEGGKALELVKQHINDRKRVDLKNRELANELGADRFWTDHFAGNLIAVSFDGAHHPDFKKPKRNCACFPKKGSEWAKRFAANPGYTSECSLIVDAFKAVLTIGYGKDGEESGWTRIGNPFSECGFAYPHQTGPYLMWVPDVQAAISKIESDGFTVNEVAKRAPMQFDGCRRIKKAEWEIMVLQHKLAAEEKAEVATA